MKFKSPIISAASGSIGGATYSHNRGGLYIRSRSIPVNTVTTRRTAIRGAFATAVAAWAGSLTAAQRGDWTAYAEATPVVDQFGDAKVLTGQQMFVRTNTLRQQASLALILDAPSTPGLAFAVREFTRAEIALGGSNFEIDGDFTDALADDGDVCLFIGTMMGAGQNYFRGPYQFVGATAVAATDTNFSETTLTYPPVGASARSPADGDRYSFRGVVVYDDGRVSNGFEQIVTVGQAV